MKMNNWIIKWKNIENKCFNTFWWFAFDLDWTLFNKDWIIEENILNKIKEYLKLQLPIIFVTWRWPWITDKIIFKNELNKYSDIYIINYNWTLIRKIHKWSNNYEILREIKMNDISLDIFTKSDYLKNKLITKESWRSFYTKKRDYMITLVFKESEFENWKLNFKLIDIVEKIIKENNLKYKVLYSWHTIDLIPLNSWKENAVKFIENKLWITNKLARVWDKWNDYWNDYDMISNWNWFTVSEWDTSIPIINDKWIQLFWQEAIQKIFKILTLNWNTKLKWENIWEKELKTYKKIWEEVRKNFLKESIESWVNNIFSFDWSITFNKEEFDILKKQYSYLTKYLAEYWWQYYSRNKHFYLIEKDINKKQEIFFNRFEIIKNDFLTTIQSFVSFESLNLMDRKILLTITDLFKIYFIKYLHYCSYLKTIFDIDLSNELNKIKNNLFLIEKFYINLLENKNISIQKNLNFNINNFDKKIDINIKNHKMYEKSIREDNPEASHPYFNYIYAKKVAKQIIKNYWENTELILIWLHYWWIELPYLLEVELKKMWFKWKITKIGAHYSNYSNSLVNWNLNIFDEKIDIEWKICIVQDDWWFTWKSLFVIGDKLLKKWASSIEYSTVHFSWDRAQFLLKTNWWLNFNFLEYLTKWWIVRVWPFYKKWKKFNIEKQRVKRIIK